MEEKNIEPNQKNGNNDLSALESLKNGLSKVVGPQVVPDEESSEKSFFEKNKLFLLFFLLLFIVLGLAIWIDLVNQKGMLINPVSDIKINMHPVVPVGNMNANIDIRSEYPMENTNTNTVEETHRYSDLEQKAICENSGGTWKSDHYSLGCICPAGKILGNHSICLSESDLKSKCLNTEGTWKELRFESAGQWETVTRPYRYTNCEGSGSPIIYGSFICDCGENQCANVEGGCLNLDENNLRISLEEKRCKSSGGEWLNQKNECNCNEGTKHDKIEGKYSSYTQKEKIVDSAGNFSHCETHYGAAAKPVIYLYPQQKQDVSVKLDYQGQFTVTYPEYKNGWNVTAYPNSKIINKGDNKEYSYLFWEGEGERNYDLSKGFVIEGEKTSEFLQDKLSKLGLTPKEYNEFIVYWMPKMLHNKYNLIHFASKEEYDDKAVLDINPRPDSILRVFMVFRPLETKINVTPQEIKPFERKGFTVVEWGGTELE